ncbi:MAG: hypothetical protein ACLFUB_21690, partial [Cyclobacteriaceae bacterium]
MRLFVNERLNKSTLKQINIKNMSTVIAQQKTDIRKAKPEAINAFLAEIGEKPFRAKQIHEWL